MSFSLGFCFTPMAFNISTGLYYSIARFALDETNYLLQSQGDACTDNVWNNPGIGTVSAGVCFDVFGGVVLISLLS
jgi:hypothetical protein